MSWRRIIALGLFLVVFCLFFLWFFVQDEPISQGPHPVARSSKSVRFPVRTEKAREEPPEDVAPPADEVPECPDDVLDDVLERCSSSLIAASCVVPFGYLDEGDRPHQAIEAACGQEVEFSTDCSSWPCIVLMEGPAPECMQGLLPISGDTNIGLHPVAYGLSKEVWYSQFIEADIRAREPQRLKRLERVALQGGVGSSPLQVAGCEQASQWASHPPTCDALMEAIGCERDPSTEVSAEMIEQYLGDVDALLERHAENCEAFDNADWSLDCSDVPCVIVLADEKTEPQLSDDPFERKRRLTCGLGWSGGGTSVTMEWPAGPLMTFPLYPDQSPYLVERFQKNAGRRRFKAMLGKLDSILPWRDHVRTDP